MKNLIKILLPVTLACVSTNAYAECAAGQGGVTNYDADKQGMVDFIQQTVKNIHGGLEYLHHAEYEFYSDPQNRQMLNFDNLVEAGVVQHSHGGRYEFLVGQFWVNYLPNTEGVLVDCDSNDKCSLKPII